MTRIWLAVFILDIALTAAALISCLSAEEGSIRALPRIVWVLIILLFSPIGAIAWFVAGREQAAPATGRRMGGGFPEQQRPSGGIPSQGPARQGRPLAPDDDPEFLRQISRKESDDDKKLLSLWEEDLKRREEELRKRENPDG